MTAFAAEVQRRVARGRTFSVLLTDDAELRRLNRQFRGKNKATDVLSFPIDSPWDAPEGSEEIILGDIMIATNVAQRQSLEYGTSFDEEMNLLLVHGILHLLEYDHIDDDEAKVMEGLEKEILLAWSAKSDA
ncbi:MAG: rRNA maturation RNase YbeY [Actinobacteria bacterium]|nr:rRNA maturation RNase YbeY [Actinomycetota bacterium]